MICATSGWASDGSALMEVVERDDETYSKIRKVASYQLVFLPDTNEVALTKGNEILFSEAVE